MLSLRAEIMTTLQSDYDKAIDHFRKTGEGKAEVERLGKLIDEQAKGGK